VRRDRWFSWARVVISLAAIGLVPWGVSAAGFPELAFFGVLGALLAYFWSAVSLAGTDRGTSERKLVDGSVKIDAGQLIVTAGKAVTSLPLSRLDGGWIERSEPDHRAVLSFSDGRVVAVELRSEQAASALLARAGAGADARAVRMRGYREDRSGRKIAGFFLAFFGLMFLPIFVGILVTLVEALRRTSARQMEMVAAMSVGAAPLLLTLRWLWRKVRPTWIQIGADGVMLQGAFRKRFFSHADIVQARPVTKLGVSLDRSVEITLRNGRKHLFPASNEAEAAVVCDRLRAAQAVAAGQERARLLDVLARAGRPVTAWKEALGSLVVKSGYRAAGHDLEAVMRVVEDVAAPLEQRVAAALAARPHGGEAVEKRIRIAAAACVEPRVRVALEKASAGALEDEALAEIGAEEARSATRRARDTLDYP